MTYYAWSNFVAERNEWNQPTKTIKPGEKITQQDLGVTDDDWQAMIDAGAIRTEPYPENLPPQVSPMEHERAKIRPKTDRPAELSLLPKHPSEEEETTQTESVLDKALGLG